MIYHWDWSVPISAPYLGWLMSGLAWTLLVAGAAWVLAFIVGVGIGILRTLPNRAARRFGALYVTIFRSIPLLLQLFLWYFVVPELLPASAAHWIKRDLPLPEYWTSVIGLGLFTAARIAEQIRAGIEAVGRGQSMAAAASGLTLLQSYRYVVLPVAARYVLPPLTSEFLNVIKNSSLALTIGLLELTGQSRQIEGETFHGIEAFTAATLIYVVLTLAAIAAMRALERVVAIPGVMARV
ncbi:MAG: Glutamate transporter permease [Tardiphaga sp.]|uniref:amino acid ABC transporter permease n=1 Tax=Tardiphaga sp. TaxID=1926292 RepID=UPI002635397B|nr:amino acid ABC transporter permease [Tardiphaga sp.]MDB5501336.1 Glutamate transporter permease [Tardiphaga sp.]